MAAKIKMISWSLINDIAIILGMNFLFLLFLQLGNLFKPPVFKTIIFIAFLFINTFVLLVNVVDIFYFKFHFQRLNADVQFVIDHPFQSFFNQSFFTITFLIFLFIFLCYACFKINYFFYKKYIIGSTAILSSLILLLIFIFLFLNRQTVARKLLPTYPLVSLSNKELPMVQNSFHTLIYSFYRQGQYLPIKQYFSENECDSIFPIIHNADTSVYTTKKNIVLFIMESVPYDFFDSTNVYKVNMPFFDTIIKKSTLYTNAYSYALESNKGIVSVLAGEPTLTDVPLYHSPYVNMPMTPIGKLLDKQGYNSLFCIGDEYDNFGFAKCTNWLGINKYYCLDNIEKNKNKPYHSLGMQDEYVLDFFNDKINETKQPFLAINYNISTHYPYDIPSAYNKNLPNSYTTAMKAMSYYDNSLGNFFNTAKNESWFNNTIFIFCPDHWMFPNEQIAIMNNRSSFHIPIIIYEPTKREKKINTQIVSQFDILGTIVNIAGCKDEYISFGNNLLSNQNKSNVVFTKMNNNIYQAIDSNYVLGYNPILEKVDYLYNFNVDKDLKNNLVDNYDVKTIKEHLEIKVKAFLQKATTQYNNKPFK